MTHQNRQGMVPGQARRANDLEEGRWGHRQGHSQFGRGQAHSYHGYGGDPMGGSRIHYTPDFDRTMSVANVPAVAAGASSGPLTVYWPHGGIIVAMRGTTKGDGSGTGLASIGVQITVGDGREVINVQGGTTGATTGAFPTFAELMGPVGDQWCLLKRPVYPTLSWTVEFFNWHASQTYTPSLTFFMDSDPGDVRRHYFKRIKVPEGTEVEVFSQRGSWMIDTAGGAVR